MSCVVCGSSLPCNCRCSAPLTQDPVLCNSQPQGCCQNTIVPTPIPFYACAPACPESHVQRIVLQQFFSTISVADSWNVPACDGSAVLNVVGLKGAIPGSFIFNASFGYFEITAFDAATGQITVLNTCITGNAAAGTNIPACTEFIVTDPPCDCTAQSGVCVAIDFTAPAVGNCLDITLTDTTGIQIGFVVQIGAGEYRVAAVKPNEIITICNDGSGITPGTSVIAKNAQGQFQYCLQIISSNPCDGAVVQEVIVLGCSGELIKPLAAGAFSGVSNYEGDLIQSVSLIGTDDRTAAYRPLDTSARKCTTLSQDLIITAGVDTYVVQVVALNGITVFDLAADIEHYSLSALIQGTTPNTISIKFRTVPGANTTIPAGSWLCVKTCCEFNSDKLQTFIGSDLGGSFSAGPQDVNSGAPTLDAGVFSFNISNSSELYIAFTLINIQILFSGTVVTGHSQKCQLEFQEDYGEDVPVAPDTHILRQYYTFDDAGTSFDEFLSRQMVTLLLPGQTKTINVQAKIVWGIGNANFSAARIEGSVFTLQTLFG